MNSTAVTFLTYKHLIVKFSLLCVDNNYNPVTVKTRMRTILNSSHVITGYRVRPSIMGIVYLATVCDFVLEKLGSMSRLEVKNEGDPHCIPPQTSLSATDVSKDDGSGYNCEFVEPPPSAFQTQCPICQLILREPYLISCCGYKFCRKCIEPIVNESAPCRLCREPNFTCMREGGLERSLKELEVWCTHKKQGCEWKGKLGTLELHLNRDVVPADKIHVPCQFVEVECMHKCGDNFQHRYVTAHETEQCPKRPHRCDHCQDYQSTYEDVINIHHPQCSMYPVACPNKCQVPSFQREKLEGHLRDDCPLVVVECPFHYAGCLASVPRKDMPEHMTETATHLSLLAPLTQSLVKENQELRQSMNMAHELSVKYVSTMTENCNRQQLQEQMYQKALHEVDDKIQHLTMAVQDLAKANQELKQSVSEKDEKYHEVVHKFVVTEREVQILKKQVPKLKLDLARCSEFPVVFRVNMSDNDIFSPAFYTHPHGYRICIRIYPNGVLGTGNDVSIYTYLMQGPFDKHLHWPFRGEIHVQIVNQAGDHDHVEKIISHTDNTPDTHDRRVTGREMAERGWGKHAFLSHRALAYNAVNKTQYMKDNLLIVRVMKVKVL